ncbi:MAG: hypothetical protein AAGE52_14340 [Myxococcota bacterium]
MKLVELDEEEEAKIAKEPADDLSLDEIDRILAEEAKKAPPPKAAPPPRVQPAPPPAAPATGSSEISEDRPFDQIYAEAAVPEAPYSAEKLLRVLDGLKAMDPATRKAAVVAMDAADEEWTIADAVLDAQRKITVLEQNMQQVQSQLTHIRDTAEQEKTTRDAYLAQATETIRQKIAELEQTLQTETAQIAAQKAEIDGKVEAAQAATAREAARLQGEIERLRAIPSTFALERKPQ